MSTHNVIIQLRKLVTAILDYLMSLIMCNSVGLMSYEEPIEEVRGKFPVFKLLLACPLDRMVDLILNAIFFSTAISLFIIMEDLF